MSDKLTQAWVEQTLHEINDLESVCGNYETFQRACESYEKEGKPTPDRARQFNDLLGRYAPEDMEFSFPFVTVLTMSADRSALIHMHAWSLVIETLRAGRVITMRDCRHAWGPLGIPTEEELTALWKAQKVERDPVTRSDNWLDRAEAWTLEGLARKNADA